LTVLLDGEPLQAKAFSSSHSQPVTPAHPWAPLYSLCSQVCCI